MTVAYDQAARRHYDDALALRAQDRLPNADHLAGFAAECGLKVAVLAVRGVDPDENVPSGHKKHVDVLWARLQLLGFQKRYPVLAALLATPNPFADWAVDDRYTDGSHIMAQRVDAHVQAAREILGAVGLIANGPTR